MFRKHVLSFGIAGALVGGVLVLSGACSRSGGEEKRPWGLDDSYLIEAEARLKGSTPPATHGTQPNGAQGEEPGAQDDATQTPGAEPTALPEPTEPGGGVPKGPGNLAPNPTATPTAPKGPGNLAPNPTATPTAPKGPGNLAPKPSPTSTPTPKGPGNLAPKPTP